MDLIETDHVILIIYEAESNLEKLIESFKKKPKAITSKRPNELINSSQYTSEYDLILSGVVQPQLVNHDSALLSAILRVAKPNANIVINQVIKQLNLNQDSTSHLITQLKLSGFTKISEARALELTGEEKILIQQKLNISEEIDVIEVSCRKPMFEVGSSSRLNLKASEPSTVWKLEDMLDGEVETINPDDLLDEEDLLKPTESLRVCNTTGKRKACKDCSCGLAEELQVETEVARPPASSCGSCYLGDAFRCAACPYLGMPAFKPGEKIQLSNQQLEADL